mmetsp:Transcript_348/g.732  ORF Transcript_348/g.732 Transcript_348/m.732 type:complete len:234 (+) Transcript_348:938-1639(+)
MSHHSLHLSHLMSAAHVPDARHSVQSACAHGGAVVRPDPRARAHWQRQAPRLKSLHRPPSDAVVYHQQPVVACCGGNRSTPSVCVLRSYGHSQGVDGMGVGGAQPIHQLVRPLHRRVVWGRDACGWGLLKHAHGAIAAHGDEACFPQALDPRHHARVGFGDLERGLAVSPPAPFTNAPRRALPVPLHQGVLLPDTNRPVRASRCEPRASPVRKGQAQVVRAVYLRVQRSQILS